MSRGVNQELLTTVAVTTVMTSTAALASEAKRSPAGQLADGAAIEAVTLTNKAGLSARVLTYGATLQSVMAPTATARRPMCCSAMTRPTIM